MNPKSYWTIPNSLTGLEMHSLSRYQILHVRAEIVEHVTNRNKSGSGAKMRLVEYNNELLSYTGPVYRLFPKHTAFISIENRSFVLSNTTVFLFWNPFPSYLEALFRWLKKERFEIPQYRNKNILEEAKLHVGTMIFLFLCPCVLYRIRQFHCVSIR